MSIINDSKVLQYYNITNTEDIEFMLIFGENGKDILLVMKNGNVMGCGENTNGCLGFGHNNP